MKLMTTQLYNSLHLPMLHAISTRGHVAFVSNFSSPNRLHDGISNLVLVVKGLERFLRSGCLLVVFIFLDGSSDGIPYPMCSGFFHLVSGEMV